MKIFLPLIIFIFFASVVKSQEDAQLNIFTSSPLAINPATTGYFQSSKLRAWLNYRDQWSNILQRGLITETFSIDAPIRRKKIALGALISNNTSLQGTLNDFTAVGSFGYTNYLSRRKGMYLSFGLQAGVKEKSFNPNKLSFDKQYEDGIGYIPGSPTGENFATTNRIYPDFNAGLLFFVEDRWKKQKPWFGISAYHLTQPEESFTSASSKLPRKLIAYGGMDIITSRNMSMMPQILVANQGQFTQASIGYLLSFNNFKSKNYTTFDIGAFFRTSDVLALTGGFEYMHFKFIFSYEYTVSSLGKAAPGTGSIDFTIRYIKEGENTRNVKFY